ncbi:MAG TPA: hypothetical protein VFV50_10540 [Bdellovibrionales bacterium]|nr:hypothetical protein [Bdellovibrionales bacterium]
MHFLLPLALVLGAWLFALISGVKNIELNAVLIGCVFAYATVSLGRLTGFLPGREVHLLFIPVLVGLGATIVSPFMRHMPTWLTASSARVPITFELSAKPESYQIGKQAPAALLSSGDAGANSGVAVPAYAPGSEDELKTIQRMNYQVQEVANFRKPGNFKMPSPEEMKRIQRDGRDLLEGKGTPGN